MTSGIKGSGLAELNEVIEEQGATIARLYQRLVTLERRTGVLNHALGETRQQLADLATATLVSRTRAEERKANDQRSPQS